VITNLQNVKPGTMFRVFEQPDLSGVLVDVNECSAKVKLTSGAIDVEIDQPDGSVRRFTANRSRTTTWSPATVIETIHASAATSPPAQPDAEPAEAEASNPETETMKTVTKAKKAPNAAKEPKARKPKATNVTKGGGGTRVRSSAKTELPDKPETPKKESSQAIGTKTKAKLKPSLLDIAAEVLSDGKPRNCDQIITEVLASGDWQTSGKTPAATLYSGMIREINNNSSKPSRFERTATKGEFKCK